MDPFCPRHGRASRQAEISGLRCDCREILHAERVNHPRHYNGHPSGVEAIEICETLGFCLGNAIKYLWRVDMKGSAIEDLEKAAWYLRRALERYISPPAFPRWTLQKVVDADTGILRDVLKALDQDMQNPADRVRFCVARCEYEIRVRKEATSG